MTLTETGQKTQHPEAKTCSLEECVKVNPLEKVIVSWLQWVWAKRWLGLGRDGKSMILSCEYIYWLHEDQCEPQILVFSDPRHLELRGHRPHWCLVALVNPVLKFVVYDFGWFGWWLSGRTWVMLKIPDGLWSSRILQIDFMMFFFVKKQHGNTWEVLSTKQRSSPLQVKRSGLENSTEKPSRVCSSFGTTVSSSVFGPFENFVVMILKGTSKLRSPFSIKLVELCWGQRRYWHPFCCTKINSESQHLSLPGNKFDGHLRTLTKQLKLCVFDA